MYKPAVVELLLFVAVESVAFVVVVFVDVPDDVAPVILACIIL